MNALVCGIDQTVGINKCKTLQAEKLFHIPLVSPHVLQIAQVLFGYQSDGDIDDIDVVFQIILNDLLPASCQFVKVHKTHRPDSTDCIIMGSSPRQDRSADQYDPQQDGSDDYDNCGAVRFSLIHV